MTKPEVTKTDKKTANKDSKKTSTKSNKKSAKEKTAKKVIKTTKTIPKNPKPVKKSKDEKSNKPEKLEKSTGKETSGKSDKPEKKPKPAEEVPEPDKAMESGRSDNSENTKEQEPSSEELETTKPTINQMKKPNRKLRSLSQTDIISTREHELLSDELSELHTSVMTLKHSYGSIMNSLIALQKRRPNKKNRKVAQIQKFGLISTPSTTELDLEEIAKQQKEDEVNPYDIVHFLNPHTRDEAFKMLFADIDKLEESTEKYRTCFDSRGSFVKQKFTNNCKNVNRPLYNLWTFQTYRLIVIVDEIIRNYNDDLLSLFRL